MSEKKRAVCPFCYESIAQSAQVCPHCRTQLISPEVLVATINATGKKIRRMDLVHGIGVLAAIIFAMVWACGSVYVTFLAGTSWVLTAGTSAVIAIMIGAPLRSLAADLEKEQKKMQELLKYREAMMQGYQYIASQEEE